MRLLAIANILRGKETVGFRLLDSDEKKVKDVGLGDISRLLINGSIQIDNITIKDSKVVGSNGSIERLPKIVNSQLFGKSPLIVISQIDDVGYVVSDYKGNIVNLTNANTVKYAKSHGISNGKVVTKDGVEFISSIEGTYNKVDMSYISKKNSDEKYVGEPILGAKPLNPIVIQDYGQNIYYYTNGKYRRERATELDWVGFDNIRQCGSLYVTDKYTLVNSIRYTLDTRKAKDMKRIREFIGVNSFLRDKFTAIDRFYMSSNAKRVIDKETKLVKPSHSYPYNDIELTIESDESKNTRDDISEASAKKHMKELAVMKCKVHVRHKLNDKPTKLAIVRYIKDNGVYYMTLDIVNNSVDSNDISLENIYYNRDEYANITIEGSKMIIQGLDSVYQYDMDLIHNIYKKRLHETDGAKKAKILGQEYIAIIDESGNLASLKSELENLVIPKEATRLLKDSIDINGNNKSIIFSSNLKHADRSYITGRYRTDLDIQYVEIDNNECAMDILTGLVGIFRSNDTCTVRFKQDITPEIYEYVMYEFGGYKNIQVDRGMDDTCITGLLDSIYNNRLDKFSVLMKPVKLQESSMGLEFPYSYRVFDRQYAILTKYWKNSLRGYASSELQAKYDKLFKNIDNRVAIIEQQAEEFTNKHIERLRIAQVKKEERLAKKNARKNKGYGY